MALYLETTKAPNRKGPTMTNSAYKITNPDRGVWNVYEAGKYEDASSGVDIFDATQYAMLKNKLAGILIATFKTRKAAREYVASIGGTC